LKHPFSQVEGDLDLLEISKFVPLPPKKLIRKKTIVMIKEKDEENNKVGKDWMDSEILHLMAL